MFLSRLCKLKIGLIVLVPYAVLAFGSGLLHNHGAEDENCSVGSALCSCVRGSGIARLSATPSCSHHERGECPACSFARANQSGSHIAFTLGHTTTVSNLAIPECFPCRGGATRLPVSRGPPLG